VARPQVGGARQPTEGEQWSRDLLDRLRERRFTAAAWRDFMADAFVRARRTRARRPALTTQSRRWGAAGLAAAVPFGPRPAAHWALWWAMVDWHLGMAETPAGDPRPLRPHDALTLARLWIAPIVRRHPHPGLLAAALATDVADGALARRAGPTRLGRDLDSTADTLLTDQALRGLIDKGALPPGILTLERARLALATAVVFASYFGRSEPTPAMSARRPAAALAGAGLLLAATGRRRSGTAALAAASGYRALVRVSASRAPRASAPG
jgi:phosphatidylglycerophosphate synthase